MPAGRALVERRSLLVFSKDFVFDTWQIGTYLELINAYNRKNVLQFSYDEEYERDEDGEVKKDIVGQLPLLPYFGVILEF